MRPTTPNYNFSPQAGPSSPPQTPTTSQFQYRQYKTRRNGMLFSPTKATDNSISNPMTIPREQHPLTSSPFYPTHTELSPRSSSPTSSTHSSARSHSPPPPRSLSSSPAPPMASATPEQRRRIISFLKANFTVEEFRDSEYEDFDSDNDSIIRPSQYEDAESERGDQRTHGRASSTQNSVQSSNQSRVPPQQPIDPKILSNMNALRCSDSDAEEDEGYLAHQAWVELQRAEKRRKRRSSSSFKRNFTQSLGSSTDDEDLHPGGLLEANEAGSSARRLRRKTDRTSLIFDDPPPRIDELEEPESCEELVEVEENGEELMREGLAKNLPYWIQEDMDLDTSSSEEESDDE